MTPLELGAIATMVATAYGPGCGATGLTRLETVPRAGHTIAADWRVLPARSVVHVAGVGRRTVEDTGSAIKGHAIDIYMPDCAAARSWGRRARTVVVLRVGSRSERAPRTVASALAPDDGWARVQPVSAHLHTPLGECAPEARGVLAALLARPLTACAHTEGR